MHKQVFYGLVSVVNLLSKLNFKKNKGQCAFHGGLGVTESSIVGMDPDTRSSVETTPIWFGNTLLPAED